MLDLEPKATAVNQNDLFLAGKLLGARSGSANKYAVFIIILAFFNMS